MVSLRVGPHREQHLEVLLMSKTLRVLLIVDLLILHTIVTVFASIDYGYIGLWKHALADWGARQILSDLFVSCLLLTTWLVPDARKHGINPWPYAIATLPLGSFAPLAYLLHREWVTRKSAATARVPAAA